MMITIAIQSSSLRTVSVITTTWFTLLGYQVTVLTVVIQRNVTDLIGTLTWPVLITLTLRYTELVLTDIAILNDFIIGKL